MSDVEFYRTRMGHTFYNRDVPELVKQLTRLNDLLEQLLASKDCKRVRDDSADTPIES